MAVPERRIVLLGKTGVGKSALANTIIGEKGFQVSGSSNSVTSECQSETKEVGGRRITVVDTPGFFDTNTSKDYLKSEMIKCVTESAPGVHAFLIVLKLERFTQHEKEVISKIKESFTKKALKHAVIVFTHGDQLEDQKIEDFVKENHDLRDLVEECGGRCHVIDNKYWDKERNNEEVKKLLNTIDKMVEQNNGEMYTNEMLKQVHSMIKKVKNIIQAFFENKSEKEINEEAQKIVSDIIKKIAGISTGVLLGALLGISKMVGIILPMLKCCAPSYEELVLRQVKNTLVGDVTGAATTGIVHGVKTGMQPSAATVGIIVLAGVFSVVGAVKGGHVGFKKADEANSVGEAAWNTAVAMWESTTASFKEAFQTKKQTTYLEDTKKD